MEQTQVKIGEIEVPIIIDADEEWFPVTFITTKVLLRDSKWSLINKTNREKVNTYLRKFKITFGKRNAQVSNCINKKGLIEILKNTQVSRLSIDKRDHQNHLHGYLGIELLPTEESKIKKQKDERFKIFEKYRFKKINRLPDCYDNKESFEEIIKELFSIGEIDIENLTYNYLVKEFRLSGARRYLTLIDIYKLLFGEYFYYYPWKYPKFNYKEIKLTDEIAIKVVNNYINDNNIVISNIFKFEYADLFSKCGLKKYVNDDVLSFVVRFYGHEYAGYLFKTKSNNYYKNENNLLFDLKYLIEKDMKLEVDKIPLYLTKYTLQKKCKSLYHYIITNKNGSLYEWYDKLYPNKFTLYDFELNGFRNEYDSDQEMYIHEILTKNFNNVIYNQKHTDRTIRLDDMIPDWLVMTENGVWIIEYFGLCEERQYGKSSRVTDYMDKVKSKIERYKEMSGYKFIFLYPKDIEGDFRGTREIVAKMKENPYVSML